MNLISEYSPIMKQNSVGIVPITVKVVIKKISVVNVILLIIQLINDYAVYLVTMKVFI